MNNMARNPSTPRQSDLAYAGIVKALFDGQLKLGSFISQADLSAVTGLGVGPVRDALKMLEADGIIIIHPRSGIEVLRPTTELARSTYQFRSIIERFAVRQFTLTASLPVIDGLIALHDRALADLSGMPAAINLGSYLREVEDGFHLPVVASLSNAIVDSAYGRLRLLSGIVRLNDQFTRHAAEISIGEHLDILHAARARDPDQAEAAMLRHLTNALQRNLGLV
jgi:DNA-binding GntR family transcriptional regulator